MELDQLLFHVKEKLSEVLLPVETVTKLEIFGKGMYILSKIEYHFYGLLQLSMKENLV